MLELMPSGLTDERRVQLQGVITNIRERFPVSITIIIERFPKFSEMFGNKDLADQKLKITTIKSRR